MNSKTNIGLVEYAKAQLGKPYWWGTFGQTATKQLLDSKRKQYPSYYKADDFESQIGERVHDCAGLIEGYMWSDTPTSKPVYKSNGFPEVSADSLYNMCKKKGTSMGDMPNVVGIAVFMRGHVGVYIGNGEVIEARGHEYGVVKTKLARRPWKRWAFIDEIEYVTPQPEKPSVITNNGCHYI